MARTSRNGAPSPTTTPGSDVGANASALDNLDLDGMFAEDGDMLFDGLDIDLDQMGDITSNNTDDVGTPPPKKPQEEQEEKTTTTTTTPSSSKRRSGPKTKRPPPPPAPAPAQSNNTKDTSSQESVLPKRRKTKRKTKSPLFWNDDDYVEGPKKKRRPTKGGTAAAKKGAVADAESSSSTPASSSSTPAAESSTTAASSSSTTTTITTKSKKKKALDDKSTTSSSSTSSPPKPSKGGKTRVTTSSMPPPLPRSTSSSAVAAAGQFGGRFKRSLGSSLPLHSTKGSSKSKRKTSSSSSLSDAAQRRGSTASDGSSSLDKSQGSTTTATTTPSTTASSSVAPSTSAAQSPTTPSSSSLPPVSATSASRPRPMTTTTPPPKPEPTYCGLKPSNTLFYPFMSSLPPEPGLKNRKLYPIMDKICSAFTSQMNGSSSSQPPSTPTTSSTTGNKNNNNNNNSSSNNSNSNSSNNNSNSGNSSGSNKGNASTDLTLTAVYKLLAETYEQNDKDKSLFTADKRAALSQAIPELRQVIQSMDKTKLVGDLYGLCGVLKRQHGFLKQNLQNMDRWCKENFSTADYKATYHANAAATSGGAAGPGSANAAGRGQQPVPWKRNNFHAPCLASLTSPYLKIKIKFTGWKEKVTKGSAGVPLVAMLPANMFNPPPSKPQTPSTSTTATSKASSTTTKKRKSGTASVSAAAAATTAATLAASGDTAQSQIQQQQQQQQQQKQQQKLLLQQKSKPKYADARPEQRRQRIIEQVSNRAIKLETIFGQGTETTNRALAKRAQEVQKLITEDEAVMVSLHTQMMWQLLETHGYFNDELFATASSASTAAGGGGGGTGGGSTKSNSVPSLSAAAASTTSLSNAMGLRSANGGTMPPNVVQELLHSMWTPEVNERGLLQEVPMTIDGVIMEKKPSASLAEPKQERPKISSTATRNETKSNGQETSVDQEQEQKLSKPSKDHATVADRAIAASPPPSVSIPSTSCSSRSLFDRLQSLLVEERDSDDNDSETTKDFDSDNDDDDSEFRVLVSDDDDHDDDTETDSDSDMDMDPSQSLVSDAEEEQDRKRLRKEEDKDLLFYAKKGTDLRKRRKTGHVCDLSKLSLEERTFLHLRIAGLIRQPIYPSVRFLGDEAESDGNSTAVSSLEAGLSIRETPTKEAKDYSKESLDAIPSAFTSKATPGEKAEDRKVPDPGVASNSCPEGTISTTNDEALKEDQKEDQKDERSDIATIATPSEGPEQEKEECEAREKYYSYRDTELFEMGNVIGAMSDELAQLSKINNARVAFLESAGLTVAAESYHTKRRKEEQTSLQSKCQALLKKNKESRARSSRAKSTTKKDEYNLPW